MRPWKSNEKIEVIFDESQRHRLFFCCEWDSDLPLCLFIMLNPSLADMEKCDRTLDKCIKIAKSNSFGSIGVVNLFSLRSKEPEDLLKEELRTHPENIEYVKRAIDDAKIIVAAWGEKGAWFNATYPVLKYLEDVGRDLHYLKLNRYGMPQHPLFLKSDTTLKKYKFRDESLAFKICI